jgi:hypothetical protein
VTAWEHHVPLAFHSGREADHSPPSSAEVKEWVELYLHYPNTPSWRGAQLVGAQEQLLLKYWLLLLIVNSSSMSWFNTFVFVRIFYSHSHYFFFIQCLFAFGRHCPGIAFSEHIFTLKSFYLV